MIKGNVLLVDDDKDIVESMEIHLKNDSNDTISLDDLAKDLGINE